MGPLPICRGSVPVGVGRKRKERRTESVERAAVAARGGASAYMPGKLAGGPGRERMERRTESVQRAAAPAIGKER